MDRSFSRGRQLSRKCTEKGWMARRYHHRILGITALLLAATVGPVQAGDQDTRPAPTTAQADEPTWARLLVWAPPDRLAALKAGYDAEVAPLLAGHGLITSPDSLGLRLGSCLVRVYTTADGLGSNKILNVLEDRDGVLWFAAYGGGVTRYDGTAFQTLLQRDGLVHDAAQQVLQDRQGDFWIATEGGLSRYRPRHETFPITVSRVTADRDYGPAAEVILSVQPAGKTIEIAVADTGIGIPAADLPLIFEEFRQVTRQGSAEKEGTGLGLAIARKSVELLGGTIAAQSEVGQGTRFTVRLQDLAA